MRISTFTIILAAFLLNVSLSSCSDNNVSNNNDTPPNSNGENLVYSSEIRPLLLEFTSTGCPGCGSWGKGAFRELITKHPNVVPLAVHIKYNDPMITPISNALGANRYGELYTPQIWVQDSTIMVLGGGINNDASLQRAGTLIGSANEQKHIPLAVSLTVQGDSAVVKMGVQSVAEQEVFMACYLVESGIRAQQAGYSQNPAAHDHVIRAAMADAPFGITLSNKIFFVQGDKLEATASFLLTEKLNKERLHAVVVLWKKQNGRFIPLNSNSTL